MSISEIEIPEDHVARTLTCDVMIAKKPHSEETLVSDCGFLRYNRAAKDFYGCELGYRYKSQFRSKNDTLHAQCRMVASQQGHHDYNSSSLSYLIRADGEGVWTRQDVTTYHEDGITYWLTALYPSSQPGLDEACNLNEYGVTPAEVQAACGRFTVADIQQLPDNLTSAIALSTIIPEGQKICNIQGQATVEVGGLSGFLSRFLHCCQRCGHMWVSQKLFPRTCARRTQGEDFGCGTKSWWRK